MVKRLTHWWHAVRARWAAAVLQDALDHLPRRERRQMVRAIAANRVSVKTMLEEAGDA